jgi:hypothetical protein
MGSERSELQAVWIERIKTQRASGQFIKEWCAGEGISYHTFQGWVRRLGLQTNKESVDTFVKVVPSKVLTRTPEVTMAGAGVIDVTLIRLKLPSGYGSEALAELIGGLTES